MSQPVGFARDNTNETDLEPDSARRATSQRSSPGKRSADEMQGSIFDNDQARSPSISEPSADKKPCLASGGPPITSEPVVVIVGEEQEKFYVHAHLLESSSEYFLATLSSERVGDTLRTVKLPDVDADAFRLYAKWLYTGRFHLSIGPDTYVRDNSTEMHWDEMSACYALSATIQASAFGDATIDAFIGRMIIRNDSPIELAKWIYPRTAKGSAHRSLCRDIVVHTWDRKLFGRLWKEDYPREFLENVFADVSLKFDRGVRCKETAEFLEPKNGCTYHEHKRSSLPCYKIAFGNR
ncbi:hypothetical protein HBI15_218070 [Parastagonospora nodorum]|nr:hypothetical protein HBI15_218070 [Parastagonospora nodorum]